MPEEDTILNLYEKFNQVECLLWWLLALGIWFVVKRTTRRHRNVLIATSIVLIVFGVSDYYEAQCRGPLPAWLWVWKISCAVLLLVCRFHFIGWDKFSLRDRTMRFGLACLAACILVMLLQQWAFQ